MPIKPENTVCLFACHFKNQAIPQYLKVYLSELKKHVSHLILINEDDAFITTDAPFLKQQSISTLIQKNEGYDFGSWMSGLDKLEHIEFEHVIFANDSCMLIQPLNRFFAWLKTTPFDFAGIVNSNERKYHVQSYFMIANQAGLSVIREQFNKHGIIQDKRKLIKQYEVGISQSQLKQKNKVATYLQIPKKNKSNPMFHQTLDLIKNQFPLIKKQLVFNQLSEGDVIALKSAGLYTGPQVIKDHIVNHSEFKGVDWNMTFKDLPINR